MMEMPLHFSKSGSQPSTQLKPKWSRQVQESFDLYHELDVLRDKIQNPDTIQAIDDCQQHLLFTLNAVFVDLGKAPASADQLSLSEFMHQISRRLQAENGLVKSLIEHITTVDTPVLQKVS